MHSIISSNGQSNINLPLEPNGQHSADDNETRKATQRPPQIATWEGVSNNDKDGQHQTFGAVVAANNTYDSTTCFVTDGSPSLFAPWGHSLFTFTPRSHEDKKGFEQQQWSPNTLNYDTEDSDAVVGKSFEDDVASEEGIREKEGAAEKEDSELDKDDAQAGTMDTADDSTTAAVAVVDLADEYTHEIYTHLRREELKHKVSCDYILCQPHINERMRKDTISWLADAHDNLFRFQEETIYTTVAILDRFLCFEVVSGQQHLWLIGATAMNIAQKMEENDGDQLSMRELLDFCDYGVNDLKAMELKVLITLKFDMSVPTSMSFLNVYTQITGVDTSVVHEAYYYAHCLLCEYSMLHHRPSIVATAVLALAIRSTATGDANQPVSWDEGLEELTGYTKSEAIPVMEEIKTMLLDRIRS
jgi:hypothetical protein